MKIEFTSVTIITYATLNAILLVHPVSSTDREACNAKVKQALENGTISPNNPYFYRDPMTGVPFSHPDNIVVTYPGCVALCDGRASWYHDTGPRLNTWLIPIFLLVSNMDVSPLDRRRYAELIHLMGDPIDSTVNLILKVEVWSRGYHDASVAFESLENNGVGVHMSRSIYIRTMGTLWGAMEELVQHGGISPKHVFNRLLVGRDTARMPNAALSLLLRKMALEFAESRTDDILRTCLAVFLYLYQITSAFITNLGGGNTSPPGGRVGTSIFMTWIIPVILFSNVIGGFTSRRGCFQVIQRLVTQIPRIKGHPSERYCKDIAPQLGKYNDKFEFFKSQGWNGAVYTYRPDKALSRSDGKNNSKKLLLVLALMPLCTSAIVGMIMVWNIPPNGFECRIFLLLGFFLLYIASASLTNIFWRYGWRDQAHWRLTITKDIVVSFTTVIMLFLSSSGLFNSCMCRSNLILLGANKAYFPLNIVPYLAKNDDSLYPALFAVCMGLQLCVFGTMVWIGRNGLRLMRWTEKEKRMEWAALQEENLDLYKY
jgi:hypothetical protein